MSKRDFTPFSVGTVFNGASLQRAPMLVPDKQVTIDYPARLEAMALDPAKITQNDNLVYTAGQIDISVQLYKRIKVKTVPAAKGIIISDGTRRQPLVRHSAMIMQRILNINDGLEISVTDSVNLRHCGLGSSSGLIAGVASAINELFGRPIAAYELCQFVAQNHGEEIDGEPNSLMPVQCIGGSAVCGNFSGGLIVIAGQATPIMNIDLPEDIKVVIGVPRDFEHPDSRQLMTLEAANMAGFAQTGNQYGPVVAYRLIHEVMPSLVHGSLEACKKLVFDYRWKMGSIQNCSFVYPQMVAIAERLSAYEHADDALLLSLSSVGPGFFVLTKKPEKFTAIFTELGMRTITTDISNGTYVRGTR